MNLRDDDQLDRWLDRALRHYGNAEPRAGLEGRILANLATERRRIALQWRWGFVTASVVAVCGVLVLWVVSFSHAPHGADRHVAVQRPIKMSRDPQAPRALRVERPIKAEHLRKMQKIGTIELAKEPRLEQFPSPRPLSEQEKLLMEFVSNSPQEAVLVAQVQAERQKELDRLMADQVSNSESDQQER